MSQELDDAKFREYMRMLEAEQMRSRNGSVDAKTHKRLTQELDSRVNQAKAALTNEYAFDSGANLPFTEPSQPVKKAKAVIERRNLNSQSWEPVSVHDSVALATKQLERKVKDRRYEFRVREL